MNPAEMEEKVSQLTEEIGQQRQWVTDRQREITLMEEGVKAFPLWIDFVRLQKLQFEQRVKQTEENGKILEILKLLADKMGGVK